jgi:hypothetical protein
MLRPDVINSTGSNVTFKLCFCKDYVVYHVGDLFSQSVGDEGPKTILIKQSKSEGELSKSFPAFSDNHVDKESITSLGFPEQPDGMLDVLLFLAELLKIARNLIETGRRIINFANVSCKETVDQQEERIARTLQFNNDMGSFLQCLNLQFNDAYSKCGSVSTINPDEVVELLLAGLNGYMKKVFDSS